MMGQQSGGRKQLFYSFDLDDHIPSDNLLRGIDQFLDLGDLRQHLAPFYSHTGRPSIDPQLLIRISSWATASASVRAAAMRRSAPEPGLSLVLPPGIGRRGAGSLDVLQESAWPVP